MVGWHHYCGPNSLMVELGPLVLWFSYQTVVAFQVQRHPVVAMENPQGPTTGKHLNVVEPDHKKRLPRVDFEREFKKVEAALSHLLPKFQRPVADRGSYAMTDHNITALPK